MLYIPGSKSGRMRAKIDPPESLHHVVLSAKSRFVPSRARAELSHVSGAVSSKWAKQPEAFAETTADGFDEGAVWMRDE